ncbi:hypothetical protein V4B17_02510 [Bartonella sp. B23]
MIKILKLLSGITLFFMAGCYSDQPPLTAVDMFEKPGADRLEIKKALLECGMPTLDGLHLEISVNEKINGDASIDACLVQAGFHHKFGMVNWCEKYKADNLPICQPDADIPTRSVEKRLNSPHCKENKDQPECQP